MINQARRQLFQVLPAGITNVHNAVIRELQEINE